MKTISIIIITLFIVSVQMNAQQDSIQPESIIQLPFSDISETPDSLTMHAIMARMIDGLGFRYYWATDNLTESDLTYKPSEDGRTTLETLDHLHSLTTVILNTIKNEPNVRGIGKDSLGFEAMREETLYKLKEARDLLLLEEPKPVEEMNIIFKRGEIVSEYPLWNLFNGPLADAIWHVGQIVSFRRASGNPYNSKVNVFIGKLKE